MNGDKNSFSDIGFAKLDLTRQNRTGTAETIYCAGKTNEQLLSILETFNKNKISVLGTRYSEEQYNFVKKSILNLEFDSLSHVLMLHNGDNKKINGKIAVCTGGTADLPVAEEAAKAAEFFGATVERFFDIGVAALHRLLTKINEIKQVDVIIDVVGMEGALAGVIAGLVKAPVIAVPTSVGYGASFSGLAPLLTMLNSCAEGVSVVNIDNGFGAAVQACRILNLKV